MVPAMLLELNRSVRFGLHEPPPRNVAANSYAANPMLAGLVPFVDLAVRVRGPLDADTGMLMNIRVIDAAVRAVAAPVILAYYQARPASSGGSDESSPASLLPGLYESLSQCFLPYQITQLTFSLSPYLRLEARREELPMVRLVQSFEFSAAHRLHSAALSPARNIEVFGKCNNAHGHGHNYVVDVAVVGAPDAATGIVLPIHDLQDIVNRKVIADFDHKHLNLDCPDFAEQNPTVENIARVIFNRLKQAFPQPVRLQSVRVWETSKTWCECSAD